MSDYRGTGAGLMIAGGGRVGAGGVGVFVDLVRAFVGPPQEGLRFAVQALLLLAREFVKLLEVLLKGVVSRLSLRLSLLQLGEFRLHGFALQVSLVLGPA